MLDRNVFFGRSYQFAMSAAKFPLPFPQLEVAGGRHSCSLELISSIFSHNKSATIRISQPSSEWNHPA
jgi:hypothetical protein